MWAALAARLNAHLGCRIGLFAPLLYSDAFRGVTHEILTGDNGAYHAGPGWNPVTGWGSPSGGELARALGG
jgi:kumamolisin